MSSIKGIILPETVELSTEERGFWIKHDVLRKCTHLYENGFLVINSVLLDYIGDDDEIIIPNGVEVINNYCFNDRIRYEKEPIKRVIIPASVRVIGSNAFDSDSYWTLSGNDGRFIPYGYSSSNYQKNIELNQGDGKGNRKILIDKLEFQGSQNLEYIEDCAIRECRELVGVNDLRNLKFVGSHNFWYCEPEFFDRTDDYVSFGPILINFERDWDKAYDNTLTVPDGIEFIAGGAFGWLKTVRNIVLPDTLKSIGSYAFCGEGSLKRIILPNGLKYIGERADLRCITAYE